MENGFISAAEVARRAGVSERQLEWWPQNGVFDRRRRSGAGSDRLLQM